MISYDKVIAQEKSKTYIGIPYSKLDCQALVEQILKDAGEKHNWRGSNHMWREALSYKAKIDNYNDIPPASFVFTVKNDGGEKKRGYNDNEGNACHVGLYLGNNKVIHSSGSGVQYTSISNIRWTNYGLCKYIDYTNSTPTPHKKAVIRTIKIIDITDWTEDEINALFDRIGGV